MNSVLGAFLATWAAYFLLLALLPIRYLSPELSTAVIVLALYVVTSLGFAIALRVLWRALRSRAQPAALLTMPRPLSDAEVNRLVLVGVLASAIGVTLIAYVRVSVQGIDFTQGLAVARELWRSEGEERSGVASPLSVPGYGLGFFFLAATFIGHLHWEQLARPIRRLLLSSTVVFVAAYSVLTGGRSILMLQLISFLSAGAVRRAQGRVGFPGRFWRNVIFGSVAFIVAIGYVLYIFSDRAAKSGVSADVYSEGVINYMDGATTEGFQTIAHWPEPLASIMQLLLVTGAYITHSAGTLASVMEYTTHNGVTTFTGLQELFARLGLLEAPDESWALAGAFLSLPGAFWYQYGLGGVIVSALVTATCLALSSRLIVQSTAGGLSVMFTAASMIVSLTSPLIFAPDALAFPFMVIGYLGLTAYSRFFFGVRNWWRVGHPCTVARSPTMSRKGARHAQGTPVDAASA